MNTERLINIIAGSFILVSLALGIPGSPLFISPWCLGFTGFVGANLLQRGFTRWCLMEKLLQKCGVPKGGIHG